MFQSSPQSLSRIEGKAPLSFLPSLHLINTFSSVVLWLSVTPLTLKYYLLTSGPLTCSVGNSCLASPPLSVLLLLLHSSVHQSLLSDLPACPSVLTLSLVAAIILFGEPIRWETNLQLLIDVLLTDGSPASAYDLRSPLQLPVLACNMDLVWMAEAPSPR